MTTELVTVIIPSYNHEAYVGAAIEGLLNQTHERIDLVIIDDGSSDGSIAAINSYAERCEQKFARYRFIRKPNSGLGSTLNIGIESALGEYIFINASDDVAEPDAIESLLAEMIGRDDVALVACNNHFIDGSGNRAFWSKDHKNVYNPEDAAATTFIDWLQNGRSDFDLRGEEFGSYARLLQGNYIPNGYLQRKSALVAAGMYNPVLPLEDWPMHLALARHNKFRYLDRVVFNYRWHGANTILDDKFGSPIKRSVLKQEKHFALSNGYADAWNAAHRGFVREVLHDMRRWLVTVNTSSRRRQLRLFGIYFIRPPGAS